MGLLDWAKDNRMMAQGLLGALPILRAKTQKQYDAAMERASSGLLGMYGVEEKDREKAEKDKYRQQAVDFINSQNYAGLIGIPGYESVGATLAAQSMKPEKGMFGDSHRGKLMDIYNQYLSAVEQSKANGIPVPQEIERQGRMAYAALTNPTPFTDSTGVTREMPGVNFNTVGLTPPFAVSTPSTPNDINGKVISTKPSTGDAATDSAYAKDYVDWTTGGFADFNKNMEQLYTTLGQIKSGEVSTGPMKGLIDWAAAPQLVSFFDPEFVDAKESIEEVVQRNLRVILGAQFTEKEGEKLIKRAFNPSLKPEQNAQRLSRLLKQMELAARSKQEAAEYWRENKTLSGFNGKTYSLADFTNMFDGDDDYEERKKRLGIK